MGLESVELVMNLEDAFGISIPDAVVEECSTVGQLYDAILPMVRSHGNLAIRNRSDLDDLVWTSVCKFAADLASVDYSTITRDTRFIEDLGYG